MKRPYSPKDPRMLPGISLSSARSADLPTDSLETILAENADGYA